MFMLLYGTDHEKCTPPCVRSEKVSAAAGRHPRRLEFSMHAHYLQRSSMSMAISMLNNSIINVDYNGAVCMDG